MRALVTGGGGFLGGGIVRALVERGDEVITFARGDYPWLHALGVDTHRGDIADAAEVKRAATGCDVVFHVAAKAGVSGSFASYHAPNVVGTQNVIAACRAHGIGRLVHTSSPSVVFDGRDQEGVGRDAPYPDEFLAHYPATKAEAERRVLAANDDSLATVALRPHLIWGPRDNHLVPRILERGRAGKLRRVAGGTSRIDATYVDNAVDAHIAAGDRLAADRLAPGPLAAGASCAGKAYFVSNDEPIAVGDLIDRILAAGGLPPVTKSIGAGTAYVAGAVLEALYALLRREDEPPMTRFVARQLATAHWFDLTETKRDLDWEPRVSTDDGLARLAAWLKEQAA